MFSPPKLMTIIALLTPLVAMFSTAEAQQAEYNRRMAAMQQARARAQATPSYDGQVRTVSGESDDAFEIEYAEPPAPAIMERTAQATRMPAPRSLRSSAPRQTRVAQGPRRNIPINQSAGGNRVSSRFVPSHMQLAQLTNETIIDSGGPVVAPDNSGAYETVIGEGYVDEGYVVDGGGAGCCGSCGEVGGYFECGSCCDRGGCAPGPCWLTGLSGILRNGSYFGGAVGFENAIFQVPGTDTFVQDSNFGYYAGFNLGWPLCKLTCGVFSAQFGVNSVQTSFNGNQYTTNDRDQTFLTFGLYRRVDYGLQAGLAVDYLRQRWYVDSETTQLRGDVGWVYPNGSTVGFRFGANVNDSASTLEISDEETRLQLASQDWYKFYLRRETMATGLGELFLGWTDNNQAVLGMEFDVPVAERVALQAGYTYFVNGDQRQPVETQLGGNENDAWNVSVGMVFRPQGRCYYQSYDRPLFNVADNGSMMWRERGPVEANGGDNGDNGGGIDQEF